MPLALSPRQETTRVHGITYEGMSSHCHIGHFVWRSDHCFAVQLASILVPKLVQKIPKRVQAFSVMCATVYICLGETSVVLEKRHILTTS